MPSVCRGRLPLRGGALIGCLLASQILSPAAVTDAVVSKNAPQLNQGQVKGSVRVMTGDAFNLNSGLTIDGALIVAGTPEIRVNGGGTSPAIVNGSGSVQPSGYRLTINNGATLAGGIRQKVDPESLPTAIAPAAGTGTRNVNINQPGGSPGNFATIRSLTISAQGGAVTLPPGRYERITLNGSSTLNLQAGSVTSPALYEIQQLDINGGSHVSVSGPVALRLKNSLNLNGYIGNPAHPEWLEMSLAGSSFTLNSQSAFHGKALVPAGSLTVNSSSLLHGLAFTDRLVLNGGGVIECEGSGGTPNLPPIATAGETSTSIATPVVVPLVASDPENAPLIYQIISRPANGSVSLAGALATYTPNVNFTGDDTFFFKASDGTLDSAPAAFVIHVFQPNRAPVAVSPVFVINQGETNAPVVLSGSDPDDDALTYQIATQPALGTISGNPPTLIYCHTGPRSTAVVEDAFTYTATDSKGAVSVIATVKLQLQPVNRPPTASTLTSSGNEDSIITLSLAGEDPDDDALDYEIVADPANPSATVGPLHGTLSGVAPRLTYQPAANFHGADRFYFRVSDSVLSSAMTEVSITVLPVNDEPVAVAKSLTGLEDGTITIAFDATDVDGDALSYTTTLPDGFPCTVTLSGASAIFTPEANFNGPAVFTYTAADSSGGAATAEVSLAVTPVNDVPVVTANPAPLTLAEDGSLTFIPVGSDSDGDALTYEISTQPDHGTLIGNPDGTFLYTPMANYNGSDNFTYIAKDASLYSAPATVSLTIDAIDDQPIASAASYTLDEESSVNFTLVGNDADGDALAFKIVTQPTHGVVAGTASNLTYTPAANFNGEDALTFKITSAAAESAIATVSFTVAPQNDAPVAIGRSLTTDEDTAIPITLTATDEDNEALTFEISTQPHHGTISGTVPNVTYTPSPNFNGADRFAFVAKDAASISPPTNIAIAVRPVNDSPVGQIVSVSTTEDHPLPLILAGSDVDGDELFFEIATQPSHGYLQGSGQNRIYTPAANFFGSDSFSYRVYDGSAFSTNHVVSIQVVSDGIAENHIPVVTSVPRTKVYSTPDPSTLKFTENGDWQTSQLVLSQTPEAELVVRSGDIDNFGFGWPAGFDPFAGANRPVHPWPFAAEASDPSGTDRIMIGSGGNPPSPRDGYSFTTSRPNNLPVPVSLRYSPVADPIQSARFLIFTDDFQGPVWGSKFTATLDGQRFPKLEVQINRLLQTGPTGRMVSVDVPDNLLPLLQDSSVDLLIDDATTGLGDGYVVDFVKLLINPTNRTRYFEYTLAAEDADGDPLSYRVISAPAGAEWDAQLRMIRWTPAPGFRGDVIFAFEVADNRGGIARQDFKVSAFPEDRPPVVSLQSGQNPCRVGRPLVLSVSTADDFDVIQVNLEVNGSPVALDETGVGSVTFDEVGLAEAVATVEDSAGQKSTAVLKLLVASETTQLSPIADPSPALTVTPLAAGQAPPTTPPVAIPFLQPSPGSVISGTILAKTLVENPSSASLDWFAYLIPIASLPSTAPLSLRPDARFVADSGNLLATAQDLTARIATAGLPDGAYWIVIETLSPTSGTTRTGIQVELKNSQDETRVVVPPAVTGLPPTAVLHSPDSGASLSGPAEIFASASAGDHPVVRWSLSLALASAAAVDAFPSGNSPFHEIASGTGPRDHSLISTIPGSDLSTGAWLLRLEVVDSQGAKSFTLRSFVFVRRTEAGPVVNAGPDQTVSGYSTARLTATIVSGQAEHHDTSWTAESWPESAAPVVVSPGSLVSDVRVAGPGVYTFVVRIVDPSGRIGTDRVSLTASAGANTDLIWPQDGAVISGTSPLNLVGQISGGLSPVVSVNFFLDGQSVGAASEDPTRAGGWKKELPVPTDGLHSVYFEVNFSNGQQIVSRTSSFTTFGAVDTVQQGFALDITSPLEGDSITAPTAIIGSAYSTRLASWSLSVSPLVADGDPIPPATVIASGNRPVLDGVLGVFDPTLQQNGAYQLTLSVTTTAGVTSVYRSPVVVEGAMKVGQFSLAFQDLTIPLGGLPLTVTRTYDSRDAKTGDFGPGWNVGLSSIRVRKAGRIGEGWEQEQIFSGFQPIFSVNPTTRKKVIIVFPDGRTETFEPVFRANSPIAPTQPNVQKFAEISSGTLDFKALDGSKGTLAVAGGTTDVIWNGPIPGRGTMIDISFAPANPTRFRYTEPGGTSYLIDEKLGLLSISEPNGNTLTINRSGLFHSTGENVLFTRDPSGRITIVTDPAGGEIHYGYDAAGRLHTVTDRVGQITRFYYENSRFPNYVTRITDPRGSNAIRTEFGADGRLARQIDAAGNAVEFEHDIADNQEIIRDRLGHVTVHEYDDHGNVTRTTDALGGVTRHSYDGNDNETSITSPLGLTTTRSYDSKDNLLTETDPAGHVTRYSYDAGRRPLTISDALGHVTGLSYSTNGNLTAMRDPAGTETGFDYSLSGNLQSLADAAGTTTSYSHDDQGRELTMTLRSAAGITLRSEAYAHDTNGNRLTTTLATENGPLTTAFEYDADGRVTKTTQPDGSTARTIYNAIGKPEKSIDSAGRETLSEYDARGHLVKTTFPDGTFTTSTYDVEGRMTAATDAAGVTRYTLYDALGRATVSILPDDTMPATVLTEVAAIAAAPALADNPRTLTTYDADGRVTATTDPLGNSTTFEYDDAGRRTAALGHRMSYSYDAAGHQTSSTDAKGNVTTFTYDSAGRLTRTDLPDGNHTLTGYDSLGRRISSTDAEGNLTRFAYDPQGLLLAVTDALGGVTRYGYDQRGLQTAQTDALGRTTTYEYDAMGRRTARILPQGQREEMTYNTLGQLTAHKDFNGQTVTRSYEASTQNLLSIVAPSAHPSLTLSHAPARYDFTYDVLGRRKTATAKNKLGSVLSSEGYSYDIRSQLTGYTGPNGSIGYGYDLAGNLAGAKSSTSGGYDVSYDYDTLNRLIDVYRGQEGIDPAATGLAAYNYDLNGNLNGVGYTNGVQHAYTYNALNRLTDLAIKRVDILSTSSSPVPLQGYAYTLNKNGHRTTISELSGRTITNTFDALHRLTAESITRSGPGMLPGALTHPAGTLAYGYDLVGNRQSRSTTGNTALTSLLPNQTQSFTPNDRLTSDTYDANGNTTQSVPAVSAGSSFTATDIYSFDNKLIRRTTSDGKTIDLTYNPDGHRLAKLIAQGGLTQRLHHYLTDANNPTGYAQVIEEKDLFAPSGQQLKKVHLYGHDLVSSSVYQPSTPNSQQFFYSYDGLGSVRSITNALGEVEEAFDYDAYGTLIGLAKRNPTSGNLESSPITNNESPITKSEFLFTGEQFDSDLGLYFLRARYLNTQTGRFHTQDTYEGSNGEPISLHKYLYAHANPVVFTDPSGNMSLQEQSVVIEQETSLVNLAFANVRAGFAISRQMGGSALRVLGTKVQEAVGRVLGQYGINASTNVRLAQTSKHTIDFVFKIKDTLFQLEVKSGVPRIGSEALGRLLTQMELATAKEGGKTVLFFFREASAKELQVVANQLAQAGVKEGGVQIINGLTSLVRWLEIMAL